MADRAYKFSCKIEELPVLGDYVRTCFIRDKKDFEDFSPDFKGKYLKTYEDKLNEIENLVNPVALAKEIKAITERLYKNKNSLRPLIDRIEAYTQRADATKLKISVSDFGFSVARKKIANKDTEGLGNALKILINNIDNNLEVLTGKGYSPEAQTKLKDLAKAIKEDGALQNQKLSEKAANVQANIAILNDFWDLMNDVLRIGKMLYKNTDAVKLKDYTMSELKKRVRKEGKKGKEEGGGEGENGNTESK